MRTTAAFTLIELLVVVIILVILLSLLLPSLDKALYQAELASCSGRLSSINHGVASYALAYQKDYPHRPGALAGGSWKPNTLHHPGDPADASKPAYDDRPVLHPFTPINASFNDPMSVDVDFQTATGIVEGAYHLWAGFKYTGDEGMLRVGDKLAYTEKGETPRVFRSDVVASDRDVIGADFVEGSHPDRHGRMMNETLQDEPLADESEQFGLPAEEEAVESELATEPAALRYTLSRWVERDAPERGRIDMHFARDDGSVERYAGLEMADERLTAVPETAGDVVPTSRTFLPKR